MSVRFVAGGILRFPLTDGRAAYGVMLATRPYMAFYEERAVDAEQLTGFEQAPMFIVAVHNSAYSKGRWGTRLGRVPDGLLPPIPVFFRQNILNAADCVIVDAEGGETKVSSEKCIGLERSAVWSADHIEKRIEDHCDGRPNEFVESVKVKI